MVITTQVQEKPALSIDMAILAEVIAEGADPFRVGRRFAQLEVLLRYIPFISDEIVLYDIRSKLETKSKSYRENDRERFLLGYKEVIERISGNRLPE